jgi:hypothetical protein
VLAAASLLARDEGCSGLSTPGLAEAEERGLNPLATLSHAASAPVPTNNQSLTTPASPAYSSRLLSSPTHPMGYNASLMQLSYFRLSPVMI